MMGDTTDPKREPLLGDEKTIEIFRVRHDVEPDGYAHGIGAVNGANRVRDFYEDLITKGELMVVKTVRNINNRCSGCGQRLTEEHNGMSDTADWDFCPGCGSKIVEG